MVVHADDAIPVGVTRQASPLPESLRGRPIEKILYLPCERMPEYQSYLAELMTFIPPSDPDFRGLEVGSW